MRTYGAAQKLGIGLGWRPELAIAIDREDALGFVEITGEHFPDARVPDALLRLRDRGRTVIPHGISVSLGSAEGFDRAALRRLDALAKVFDSPFVCEHLAFVRAGGVEAGHLLPMPPTRDSLNVVVENIRMAEAMLSVPLAIENISALFAWKDAEYSEAEFLREVLARTDALLLLDTSNVYANAHNLGLRVADFPDGVPLERLAHVRVGGGMESADGPAADAAAFGRHLHHQRLLPAEAVFEQIMLDIRTSRRFRCGRANGRWVAIIRIASRICVWR
ncbi:MAG TPA: DUF692 family protein, partial [Phycisphaerae bacterium]|nr:DUF692 family protein [Phycisphaerae bacterium]